MCTEGGHRTQRYQLTAGREGSRDVSLCSEGMGCVVMLEVVFPWRTTKALCWFGVWETKLKVKALLTCTFWECHFLIHSHRHLLLFFGWFWSFHLQIKICTRETPAWDVSSGIFGPLQKGSVKKQQCLFPMRGHQEVQPTIMDLIKALDNFYCCGVVPRRACSRARLSSALVTARAAGRYPFLHKRLVEGIWEGFKGIIFVHTWRPLPDAPDCHMPK